MNLQLKVARFHMNKRLHMIWATAIAISAAAASPTAFAQRIPLACQVEKTAGLNWENGQWVVSRFNDQRFVLVQEGKTLTSDSVAKAINGTSPVCEVLFEGRISCADGMGGYMLYDPQTRRGATAQLLGGTSDNKVRRDSVAIAPFVCERF